MVSFERFVDAQDPIYARVVAELKNGMKRSHWMWFIFPQFRDLGFSEMSRFYAIASLDEARSYLAHPVLGHRLTECTDLVLAVRERSAVQIFGTEDAVKFRSSMTLFARATANTPSSFRSALDCYYDGIPDARTLELLDGQPPD